MLTQLKVYKLISLIVVVEKAAYISMQTEMDRVKPDGDKETGCEIKIESEKM